MKATEKIRDTLVRRDREITEALGKLASQAEVLRTEQADVRRDMRALGLASEADAAVQPGSVVRLVTRAQAQAEPLEPDPAVAGLNRRQLLTIALTKQFPAGATKSQLVEYLEQVRGAPENQKALSVFLNTMRKEGWLANKNQIWSLLKQEGPDAPTSDPAD